MAETEREDTVVREILTHALLTVRAGGAYCPVIRLLSLFETRSQLVQKRGSCLFWGAGEIS